jgi:carboxyl-terminal processing protease
MPRYRSLPAAAIIIALSACVGAYFGHTALSAQDQVSEQYKVFTAGLRAIEDVYVGEIESDRIVYSAITGLLQTLDPHSSFMDPRSYAQTRERQEGRYYGLGITIQVINGDVIVASVFENSPCHRPDRAREHQGLDQRADGRTPQGASRHVCGHLAQARRLRGADRPSRPA